MEKETTGLYLSGHPMDEYRAAVSRIGAVSIGSIMADFSQEGNVRSFEDGQFVTLAGVIAAAKTKTTRNNTLMAYIQLEDATGSIELIAFQRVLDVSGSYVKENAPIVIKGHISVRDEKDPQIMVESLRPLTDVENLNRGEARPQEMPPQKRVPLERVSPERIPQERTPLEREASQKTLWIKIPSKDDPRLKRIELILVMFEGNDHMIIYFEDTKLCLKPNCLIHDALIKELKELLGDENVVVK